MRRRVLKRDHDVLTRERDILQHVPTRKRSGLKRAGVLSRQLDVPERGLKREGVLKREREGMKRVPKRQRDVLKRERIVQRKRDALKKKLDAPQRVLQRGQTGSPLACS